MPRRALTLAVALFALGLIPSAAFAAGPKPKVNFSSSGYAVAEDDPAGGATITVARLGNAKRLSQTVTVDYATSNGTAHAGIDYTATSGTLTFNPGEKTKTFYVPVTNNLAVDGARTVTLKLSHPTASGGRAMLGYPSTATLVISDDDSPATSSPTFQMATASDVVSESATSVPVFVVRSGALAAPASVNYSTANGSALAGTDYTAASGKVSFPAGSDSASVLQEVDVPILHNPASSPATRNFTFSLNGGQLGSPSSETVTIVNVDGPPSVQFSAPSYSGSETSGSVPLTVLASGTNQIPDTGELDVDYSTADGTALAGVNYTAASDTLQFFTGDDAASFDVPVMADGLLGDKYLTAALSNLSGVGVTGTLGTPSSATVNVLNTDQAPGGGTDPGTGGGTDPGTGTDGGPDAGGSTGTGSAAGSGSDQGGGAGGGLNPGGSAGAGDGLVVLDGKLSACGLTVKAVKKQKLLKQKALKLQLRAGKRCKVTLTTTIKQLRAKTKPHQARALRVLQKASLTLQAGKAKTVKVKFSKKAFKALSTAIRARKQLQASVVVLEKGAAKTSRRTLKITIGR